MLLGKLRGCMFYRRGKCQHKFYIAGIRIFDLFGSCDLDLDPMTFIYEPDPYPMRDTECAKMNVLYVKAVEGYRINLRAPNAW